jgi:hypothetical protein
MDIIALVEAKGIVWHPKAENEIGITCPNAANHQGGFDNKPSFDINLAGKGANCFACGFRLSPEGLLKWLMGEALDDMTFKIMMIQAKIAKMRNAPESDFVEKLQVFLPPGEPWTEDGFRGISLATYQKLGAMHVTRGRYADRIAFPIYVNGELKGVDARALLPDMQPKYLRNMNSSCKTDWLYPYDIVKEMKPKCAILGEGIFHGINGVDKGFPALSFFGVNNWSLNKLRMIINLGVEEVVFFRDNDKAGIKAEQVILSSFKDWLPVYSAYTDHVPEGKDLGDLSAGGIAFGLANKTKPDLPTCLPETEPKFGSVCRMRCPFCLMGKCLNTAWMKEQQK